MARKGKSQSKPHIQEQCGVWLSAKGRSKLQEGSTDQRILPCYGLKPKRSRTVLGETSATLPNPRIGGKQSTLSMFFKPTPILCKDEDTVKKTTGKHDTHLDIQNLVTTRNHSVSEDVTNSARVKLLHQTQGADKENEFHSDEEDFENGNLVSSKEKNTLSSVPKIDSKQLSDENCGMILSDYVGCSEQDCKQWQNFNAHNSFEGKAHIKHEHISHNARGKRKGCFDESPSSKQPRFQDDDGDDDKLSRHPKYFENCSLSENYQTISSQTNSTDDLSVSENLVCIKKNPQSSLTRDPLGECNFMRDNSSCISATGGMTSELNTNIDSVLDFYPNQKQEKGNSENVFNSVICTELTEENSFTPSILKDSSLDYSFSLEEPLQRPLIERKSDGMINKREAKSSLGLSSKNIHSMLDTPVFDTLDDFTLLM
ncbi:uncharacterized protein [Apostichopus japonicus]|uniref:uncharacterized protein n=1 Tax=Stichopus japonicus TaxID=307972 RepID=UPI003AB1F0A9